MSLELNYLFSACTGIMSQYSGVSVRIVWDPQLTGTWVGAMTYEGAPVQPLLICAPQSGIWLAQLAGALTGGAANPTGPCGPATNLFFAGMQVTDLHGGAGTCDVTITS
jgi:hypothetical protein